MFVATREIRTAVGRFALMVGVVALITVLLAALTALTDGLGQRSTSAVESLADRGVDRVVLTPTGGQAAYAESVVTASQAAAWRQAPGVTTEPLTIGHARLEAGGQVASASLWMVEPHGLLAADAPADGQVVLGQDTAATLGVTAGQQVTVGGTRLVVARVQPTRWHSHTPVATVTVSTGHRLAPLPADQVGTVLLAHLDPGAAGDATLAAADDRAGTTALTPQESFDGLAGYRSERSSLLMIQGFLYAICALVVVAFVSVWTIQRTRDLAVLRALGASRGYVLRDALGQAALLLVGGTVVGGLLGTGLVRLVSSSAPVLVGLPTIAVPVAGVLALGLLGSILATRRVTRVDPLLALGGN